MGSHLAAALDGGVSDALCQGPGWRTGTQGAGPGRGGLVGVEPQQVPAGPREGAASALTVWKPCPLPCVTSHARHPLCHLWCR